MSSKPAMSLLNEAQLSEAIAAGGDNLRHIAATWHSLDGNIAFEDKNLYAKLAEYFIERDTWQSAIDVALAGCKALKAPPEKNDSLYWDLRLIQGRTLNRIGSDQGAIDVARELRNAGRRVPEVYGIGGSSLKKIAQSMRDEEQQDQCYRESLEWYSTGYRLCGDLWNGINSATLSVVLGKWDRGRSLADEVRCECLKSQQSIQQVGAPNIEESFWLSATLGEAALILGDIEQAKQHFREATRIAGVRIDLVGRTRGQIEFLSKYLIEAREIMPEQRSEIIDQCLPVPRVVVCVGHMVDHSRRSRERFPEKIVDSIRERIKERLDGWGPVIGYSSAACGTDLLFQQLLADREWEAHLVLPYQEEGFAEESVNFAGARWIKRFELILARAKQADRLVTVSPHQALKSHSIAYEYANRVLAGLAAMRARQLHTELKFLAVWDERRGDGLGGTASHVQRWESEGRVVAKINPQNELHDSHHNSASPPVAHAGGHKPKSPPLDGVTNICALMFVDVVKFTRLTEEDMPRFVEHFFYMIGAMAAVLPDQPIMQESRGDGVFLVFDSVGQAGRFALELRDRIREKQWRQFGFAHDIETRIALHAGPVFRYYCPFSKAVSYTGHHVNEAARLEPITPAGEIYCSQKFAALCADDGIDDFVCESAGLATLPKGYGTLPVYQVRHHPGHAKASPLKGR